MYGLVTIIAQSSCWAAGYLKQQLAAYVDVQDPSKAQELQLAALGENFKLLKPLSGVSYRKLNAPATGQAAASIKFMEVLKFSVFGNSFIVFCLFK